MKYLIDNEEVSKDIYWFCKKLQNQRKSFLLVSSSKDITDVVNRNPNYDCYISANKCFIKDTETFHEWYFKASSYRDYSISEVQGRYNRSPLKNSMTFQEWLDKNNYTYESEYTYTVKWEEIPEQKEHLVTKDLHIKYFSMIVPNAEVVDTLNTTLADHDVSFILREPYGDTEIIYTDNYLQLNT